MANRNSGDVGPHRISVGPAGTILEHHSVKLSSQKEELEAFFCLPFVEAFNRELPFGPTVQISNPIQRDTSDLDYTIECQIAEYLELAETTPMTEAWGRATMESGAFDSCRAPFPVSGMMCNRREADRLCSMARDL